MKKVLLFIGLFMLMVIPISAKENKLYFVESDGKLYYDGELLDENVFMQHTDMLPGGSYTDELTIENGTNKAYTLYLKADAIEQSVVADNLLENINMKITLDGKVIYEGKATGLDYNDDGVDLQKAIFIGEMANGKSAKMLVETKLSEDYEQPDENDLSYIDWNFYAQYDKNQQPDIINPKTFTQGNNTNYLVLGIAGVLTIGTILLVLNKKRRIASTTK